ncbi:MAG: pantetheine-phosphate adenylyltransferase [Candidatus Marinimicrobia bacterium]|jgi:pantetheine-phosphate adenylyltransferase|nr:pantetheine-phosphate adenylyltransferase [Candidatus Neomarinimicrobiota bacterium]MCK9483467.1 pantetheine-phosphate adenylyltransferase [Candidatus Neomarinimicrobiota bacterium]MCK9560517.1 pantetheine-phosphate adenylyltransferase [Candidatus Neomarinimicrobiota bacterium]MDD5061316.1 pantetheine-phosphate adenylyltransferase [Candidatus Neomarinimicrobiota bacterium]MDD5539972.1 pantetheine-phosphate adenylyltransferase [Candidatus Neomarinimicrobiota bacterium]
MKVAVYPGSFDPITNGHLDVLKRAASLFNIVYIAVARNLQKSTMFTTEERLEMIRGCTTQYENVRLDSFDGLVVDYARQVGAEVIIRGLRALSDFDYEFQMALMNRHLEKKIDTVFLMPHEDYTFLSSSVVRELVKFGGDISGFVPTNVEAALLKKIRR